MRTSFWPWIVALLVAALGSGCTNPFQAAYVDRLGQPVDSVPGLEHDAAPPRLMAATNPPEDVRSLVEDGYVMIGYSRFNAGPLDEDDAVQWGAELHAQVVLLSRIFTNAQIDTMPVSVWGAPQTVTQYYTRAGGGPAGPRTYNIQRTTVIGEGSATSYVPYTVYRYNYDASYWVKEISPVLGARVYDLTPELRQQLQRNKGVVVYALVKGSPAWDAALLPGDVITRLDAVEISDAIGLQTATQALAGRKVDIHILRGGREETLTASLRAASASETQPKSDTDAH